VSGSGGGSKAEAPAGEGGHRCAVVHDGEAGAEAERARIRPANNRTRCNYYRAAAFFRPQQAKPRLDIPCRLIWGMQDGALGPWYADEKLYSDVASCFDIVRIPEAGHWVQQEASNAVNDALFEFWQRS
jgi:pimeloyl-ACP methyl ester carboxylesterase